MNQIRIRSRHTRKLTAFVFALSVLYGSMYVLIPTQAQSPAKKVLTVEDYTRWRSISGQEISGDGKWVAYADNNRDAWLLNTATQSSALISTHREGVKDFAWSPDSRYVAFSQTGLNTFEQLWLCDVQTLVHTPLTSDRVNSRSAVWSPDGKWL